MNDCISHAKHSQDILVNYKHNVALHKSMEAWNIVHFPLEVTDILF